MSSGVETSRDLSVSPATGFLDFARNDCGHSEVTSMAVQVMLVSKNEAMTDGVVAAALRAARTLRTAKRLQKTYTIAPPQLEPAPAVQPKQ